MLGIGKSAWKGFSVDQGILVDRNISRGKPQELTVSIGERFTILRVTFVKINNIEDDLILTDKEPVFCRYEDDLVDY